MGGAETLHRDDLDLGEERPTVFNLFASKRGLFVILSI
jgi:hypothetical protein